MLNLIVVYLASPRDSGWLDWKRIDCLEASLKLLKLHAPQWPVIVFHEDYTDEDQKRLEKVYDPISFEKIDISGHEQHHVNRRPDNRVGTYGYCMMCRFFAGQLQAHPALSQYTHYMRLDDDSYIMSPLKQESIDQMCAADYTYRSLYQEPHQDTWNFTLKFMEREGLKKPSIPFSRNSPYNNFHVSSLAMWNHPVVKKFLAEIEDGHYHVKDGWTDTAVHSAIIWLLGSALGFKFHVEKGFEYRHNIHCVHDGSHGKYCSDHLNGKYSWGPPACLETV